MPPAPEMRLDIATPSSTVPLHFVLSPDGRSIVFVASGDGPQQLWLRRLDRATAQPLPGTEGGIFPFWSPDGRSIGFFATGKLKRIEIAGGPPQTVTDAGLPRGGNWNANGEILFTPTNTQPLMKVPASGGKPVPVTELSGAQTSHRFPQFLPDGNRFLFFVQGNPEEQGIFLGTMDGAPPTRLTIAETAGMYLAPDRIVFVRQGTLVAQQVDFNARKLVGDPEVLADQVAYDSGAFIGAFSVSADGRIAYRRGGAEQHRLTLFDRSGKALGLVIDADSASLVYPEFSPNGQRLAVDRTVENNRDVWLLDVMRGNLARLTFEAASDGLPVWSPDGTQIAFASTRKTASSFDLYVKPSSGAGSEQLLLDAPNIQIPQAWSSDGRFLLYFDAANAGDLWALPMMGSDQKPIAVAHTPAAERTGTLSADGRWAAYDTNESGRFEVVVQPFPNATGKWQVSTGGGTFPRWSKDGKELYFIAPDGKLMAAAVHASGSSFEAQTPVSLFPTGVLAAGAGVGKPQYDVSADGRFLINQPVETGVATPITLILNWRSGGLR
jgi:Tol biopolymer transport system component